MDMLKALLLVTLSFASHSLPGFEPQDMRTVHAFNRFCLVQKISLENQVKHTNYLVAQINAGARLVVPKQLKVPEDAFHLEHRDYLQDELDLEIMEIRASLGAIEQLRGALVEARIHLAAEGEKRRLIGPQK